MKVLVIHTFYYPIIKGGAEYSLKKLAEGLVKRGHEVSVLCDDQNRDKDEIINGVRIYRRVMNCIRVSKNAISRIKRAVLELYNINNIKILEEIVDVCKPDIIYTNCLEYISPVAWTVANRHGIRIIDSQRVYTLLEMAGGKYKHGNKIWKTINRINSQKVDVSAFISEYTKIRFEDEHFFGRARHVVIHNSIDFDPYQVNERVAQSLRKNRDKFHYVYLGALSEHKGLLTLLDAFQGLGENVYLHIAGKGTLEEKVVEVEKVNKNIIFHGWLDESSVNELISSCNALVCPSIWPEPFGRVVLDGYKQGIPVVATRSGGLTETVKDEVTGLLVPPSDSNALRNAMKRLVDDNELYSSCCKNILTVLNNFSIERYLDRFELLFEETLQLEKK